MRTCSEACARCALEHKGPRNAVRSVTNTESDQTEVIPTGPTVLGLFLLFSDHIYCDRFLGAIHTKQFLTSNSLVFNIHRVVVKTNVT